MKRLITLSRRDPELPPFSAELAGRRRRVLDLPLIGWLTLIWVLLWSTLTWANIITGAVVAVFVSLAFPLPRVDLGLRLHPWGIVVLAGSLLYDMYTSGVKVTRQIFTGYPHRPAVIAVQLRCRSDLMMAAIAVSVSNTPGGSVIEVRRATATLFLHVLDADQPAALEAARRSVWRLERLTVRAFGTRDEIERVAGRPPDQGTGDPANPGDRGEEPDRGQDDEGRNGT
ncbi:MULTISPECIES: Na+/H+ antiporter subunit E [Streptomyces]|uniref:Na+/H+ antiporter subunit E n=1 Tax=Streptomyces TaxID=1883 RepID=UPI00081B41AC|nr:MULTISPECIES: Na+/H+ antiporter subunit E [unclassified Streptomyces]MYQ51456.1 Na+/H+ antiporter subunit E [Streptomyces sp. SID4941]SCD61483.1 multisubunit sodium/proton antiporter, MrpE subunit [Streptomyces sp. PalvLS-984]SDB87791.1 multisubunit sodium/proton antiporter, MrpE subunit (TC 2.A.63.1) [Streptomyces sp. AmelKG-A3]